MADGERPRLAWGTRTFLAFAVVVAASVLSAAVVALIVGPPLFHEHLLELGHTGGSAEMAHVEQAFLDAGVRSLGAGLVVALGLATLLAWWETRRLRRPLDELAAAARRVESGDYAARVPVGDGSPEFDALGEAFNGMARRLDATEESRRRLLSDVAHELRTPLSTLTAELEAIGDGLVPWDREGHELLAQQAARLQRIANDLNDVSRAEEGRFELDRHPVPVALLVEQAVATFRPRYAAKGVELSGEADGGTVVADAQRVGQILGNLIENALRHTPPGGQVRVAGQTLRGETRITVTDTGEGLTADQRDRVFDRFYRTDTSRARDAGGSGIGLTISRSLARAHGGSLTVTSPGPGTGATFTLTLPGTTLPTS
ncbi:sensor histidine kinase [Tessaracoccus oleiagri]|uniref:histidine kinase n=1 Tax=Tessaracoccus oleiagri TaxID=686624 RepID=A0A1G9HIS5_9ACTN|nr:ATP-binding protein [Tessaracoccus oleiagri]SDL12413.1 Signal transduction histidine kinase [Tessaracoccus oleiagri]